jgi:hypothetical protein
VSLLLLAAMCSALPPKPDVTTIIQRSVEANDRDFKLTPQFNYKQREKVGGQIKTSQVTMIDGTPYYQLLAVNGVPLDAQKAAAEQQKMQQTMEQRKAESASARQDRIAKYEKSRHSDHVMMSQLTLAFNFTILGTRKLRGYTVWALKAVPKPGYQPPNMDCQVLPGMEGQMWIDQKSYEWVKVTARVIRPVSIEGFLAQVQPGTKFEIEKNPVAGGGWQITHYSSFADAHILHMFNHQESDDVTYSDFEHVKP